MMKTFPDISIHENHPKLSVSNISNIRVPIIVKDCTRLIEAIEQNEKIRFSFVELVYVDEEKIKEVNKEYLGRAYVTDIITFRYDEDTTNQDIEGTLFCCAPRISEQSREMDTPEKTEFYRIFIHGLLHLSGYDDQTEEVKDAMTARENHYLQELNLPL